MVFAPRGFIIACEIDSFESTHDSQICDRGGIYNELETIYRRSSGKAVVASAFCPSSFECLIKSVRDESEANTTQNVFQMQQATAVWQSAEWGMRAFQSSFPCVKYRSIYEERGEGKVVL